MVMFNKDLHGVTTSGLKGVKVILFEFNNYYVRAPLRKNNFDFILVAGSRLAKQKVTQPASSFKSTYQLHPKVI